MACNCKKQVINNLKSTDHLKMAFDVYNDVLKDKKNYYDVDDLELSLLYPVYQQLYPNSSEKPTPHDVIEKIVDGYNRYVKIKKR